MSCLNCHARPVSEVLKEVASSPNGLTSFEALRRLSVFGENHFDIPKRFNLMLRFLHQFHNTLIYILIFAAIITFFMGHLVDSGIIFAVITINAFFGFIQEGKAENAIEKISDMLAPSAIVIRDGKHVEILAAFLVPGDIVHIKSGDKISADIRLIETKNLQVQESILTGESNHVEKDIAPVSYDAPLGDRKSMVYSGTIAIYGRGNGVVVATGKNTEIGKIGTLLTEIKPLTTPLLRSMDTFGRWLSLAIVLLAVFTFLVGVFVWNESVELMFMAAVGLAVAAIPEGLPPTLTIILSIGVTRMARRNAIVRYLPAVETMGAVTVICTDKTGTLTLGNQTVNTIITSKNHYLVEGDEVGTFRTQTGKKVDLLKHPEILETINASLLCNDAEFSKDACGDYLIQGNIMDKAFVKLGLQTKIDPYSLRKAYPRIDLIPYESEHKYMATLHHDCTEKGFIYVKGAPEKILQMCSLQRHDFKIEALQASYWTKHIDAFSRKGHRVLAIAYKEISAEKRFLRPEDLETGMILMAVFAIIDVPRLEVASAIEKCYRAGIKVKMITGDHAATAETVGSQVGIDCKSGTLLGSDIEAMDDERFTKAAESINIYARTSPQHKIRLVQALQASGEVVAMTGDGVNDAPALRQADIGIAMGGKGAAIAKEASTIVITDDNFSTIVYAIEEGRVIFDNLRKVILFALPTNMAMAFVVMGAVLCGFVLPMTPLQILWVNTVTAVTLSIALGFESAEEDVMSRPPRDTNKSILSPIFIWRLIFIVVVLLTCVFYLFTHQRAEGLSLPENRTMAVNMLVLGEIVCLIHCRKFYASASNLSVVWDNKAVLISILTAISFQLAFTYLPVMQNLFGTTNVNLHQWAFLLLLSSIVFIVLEIEKLVARRLGFL